MRLFLASLAVAAVLRAAPLAGADGGAEVQYTPIEHYQIAYRMIELGGSKTEMNEALDHLKAAVSERYVPAITLLGTMVSQGLLVERDPVAAAKLLELAAKAGDPTAMNNLAVLLAEGNGIERNYDTERHWAVLAGEKGIESAADLVGAIDERIARGEALTDTQPAPSEVTMAPATPIASAVSTPAVSTPAVSTPAVSAPVLDDRYYIQLAAVVGDRDPESEWERLRRVHRETLTAEEPIYQIIERERDSQSFIRILLGPLPDKDAARAKCESLKENGVKGCLVRQK